MSEKPAYTKPLPDLRPEDATFWEALKEHRFIGGNPEKGDVPGAFRGERWQRQFDTMKELGVIRGRFELSDAWTGQFSNSTKTEGSKP